MKTSNERWREALAGQLAPEFAEDIDIFETELELKRQDRIEDRIFAEERLRRGTYGQRYDNGRRNDGDQVRTLAYPGAARTKGPNTLWEAPGMQRIKIPYGGLNARQLEVLADLSEEYSVGIAHITTRQDVQYHFVHVENTPALMRRLAAVGITTREACGNVVRNVTACPCTGVCQTEAFDVTPYAGALSKFLLGHPDCQDFGRKFKPSFSGCAHKACGLAKMHDVGAVAVTRQEGDQEVRGFQLYVGGGLGAVPHQAKPLDDFLPPEELLPTVQAIGRIFSRHGEKKNRNRARLKFLIKDLGFDTFKEMVAEERRGLPHDPRWTDLLAGAEEQGEQPLREPGTWPTGGTPRFSHWLETNVEPQKQAGYATATVGLPLGDITATQLRSLADIVRRFTRETIRATVEQNFLIRWVSMSDLPDLHAALELAGLGEPGAGTIVDLVACPGTDTCKLGISSSRGLGAELRRGLAEKGFELDAAVRNLRIKISGCFNSCGQHHVADLGFYGVSRKLAGFQVPHFQLVLGGQWDENAGAFGLPMMAVPSRRIPEVVERIGAFFVRNRQGDERFQDFTHRVGKGEIRGLLEDLVAPPEGEPERSFFLDWGDDRPYSTGDIGVGECAGEVVSLVEFGLNTAGREVFESQVALEGGDARKARDLAYSAMLQAAKALIRTEVQDLPEDNDRIVDEFRTRFYDTERIFDPYAGGKFARYLFAAHKAPVNGVTPENAHYLIEEAQLFIEAAHRCYNNMVVV